MDVEAIRENIGTKIRDITVDYVGSKEKLEADKTKALVGAVALAVAYILPGSHPVLETIALGYTGLKCYHCVKDWAQK